VREELEGMTTPPDSSPPRLLRAEQAARYRGILEDVVAAIRPPNRDASVAHGLAGCALLDHHEERTYGSRAAGERATGLLNRAMDIVATTRVGSSLYGGAVGVAWVVSHVEANLGVEGSGAVGAVDDLVLEMLSAES